MTKYERLADAVHESEVMYIRTTSERIPAHSMRIDDDYGIFFNEGAFETTAERRIALAHEKAHCDTGAVYSDYVPLITKSICENRAWRRTITDVVKMEEIREVFSKCIYADGLDIYELAEKLDVTPEFAKMAIEHYHNRGERW